MTDRASTSAITHRQISDRALATALVRLARIESLSTLGQSEAANAVGHAKLALDEIANLAPALALHVEAVREVYRGAPPRLVPYDPPEGY